MPIAFTEERQKQIYIELRQAALERLIDTSYQNIKIEQLTREVGISKGAFYKFYQTKELFFYEILRFLHEDLFATALSQMIISEWKTFDEVICGTLYYCYNLVDKSVYRLFTIINLNQIMIRYCVGWRKRCVCICFSGICCTPYFKTTG